MRAEDKDGRDSPSLLRVAPALMCEVNLSYFLISHFDPTLGRIRKWRARRRRGALSQDGAAGRDLHRIQGHAKPQTRS